MNILAQDAERVTGSGSQADEITKSHKRFNAILVLLFVFGPMIWMVTAYNVMSRRTAATNGECSGHLQQLAVAFKSYARDHNGRLPNAATWTDDLSRYIGSGSDQRKVFRCPADRAVGRSSYAMNRYLSGKRLQDILSPAATVLLYETNQSGPNPAGTGKDVVDVGSIDTGLGRHNAVGIRFNYYLFADFQVRYPRLPEQEKQYGWNNSRKRSAAP
jgi:hypothetical protein